MDNRGGMQIDLQCRAGCPWYMADAKQRDEGAKRGIELMHARLESSITEAACICQENVIREENRKCDKRGEYYERRNRIMCSKFL